MIILKEIKGRRLKVKKKNILQIGLLDDDFVYLYYDFEMGVLLIFYMWCIKVNLFIEILNIFQKLN